LRQFPIHNVPRTYPLAMTKHLGPIALVALLTLAACDSNDNSPVDLDPPVLTAPDNEAVMDTTETTLAWMHVQNAGFYYVELAPDSTFTTGLLSAQTPNNSIRTGTRSLGTYYWRVYAVDRNANLGPASEVRKFEFR